MSGTASAVAAKAATATIPIVFATGGDPVKLGLVTSFNRPTGNLTGVSALTTAIMAKNADILHEVVPKAALVGLLVHRDSPTADADIKSMQVAASALGQKLLVVKANSERELETAFEVLAQEKAAGLVVTADLFFTNRRAQIVALAAHDGLPTIYPTREYAAGGGLMSYGPDFATAYSQSGVYVGRILKGEKPTDLPVIQATKFEFVINLNTAKSLGLTIPDKISALADDVIE